jgi:hypothetical protein
MEPTLSRRVMAAEAAAAVSRQYTPELAQLGQAATPFSVRVERVGLDSEAAGVEAVEPAPTNSL